MAKKRKPAKKIHLADGTWGVAPFATLYKFDGRKVVSQHSKGFPRSEDGSIQGAGREVMTGRALQVQGYNRVKGRTEWTVKRGPRIEGTHLYQPIIIRGDADDTAPTRRSKK
jgi:hypothetical protein